MYLPIPAVAPSAAAQGAAARADLEVPVEALAPRWIGLDGQSTQQQIFELIRAGDKRGAFTLPWIVERTGSPIHDQAVWVPLHTIYWNDHLAPFELSASPDMPFWIEEFELVYDSEVR